LVCLASSLPDSFSFGGVLVFGIFSFLRSEKSKKAPCSYRLRVDELEERYCPSAAHLTLTAVVLPGHEVQLTGTVTGDQVAGYNVMINGAVSVQATTDSNGNYSVTTSQASLGSIYAVGMNQALQSTDTAYASIAVTAPALTMSLSYGSQNHVTLNGTLTDIDAGSRTISISGVAGGTATTDSSGNFSLATTATALGDIYATETDLWSQVSNTAKVTATDNHPVIADFAAINVSDNVWTFQGSVSDENAEGLVVRFGGLMSLSGQTATVQADGTFSYTCTLTGMDTGTATAITTDWWGQDSNQAWISVA
jgi:hypothetical protein